MSEEMLVRHCSPTLAGLKTAGLFTGSFKSREEMLRDLKDLNVRLSGKGLRILPLRFSGNKALIYVYRPSKLSKDLGDSEAYRILREKGYEVEKPGRCIMHLIKKIGSDGEFPHEIGLFLGYPPEDVCGFIENRAACSKCVGCWKVYGNEEEAKKTFAKYKKCTEVYTRLFSRGLPLEKLTVSV